MLLPLIFGCFLALIYPAAAQNYNSAGCYSTDGGLVSLGSYSYQSSGWCYGQCAKQGKVVFATHDGNFCYCGESLPSSGIVDDSQCNINCTGYPQELCGGENAWSFYTDVDNIASSILSAYSEMATASPTSSSSSSTSTSSSSSTLSSSSSSHSASTTDGASASSSNTGSSTNTVPATSGALGAGAIAGIVVGVIAALGIIGGTLVFLKKRRNSYDYSPSSTPNGFKEPFGVRPPEPAYSPPPNGGGGGYAVDQRLNPVMLGERRISVGSLADARDYSRKILRVANPDDS